MSKFVTYAYQQMAGSGFAVLSPQVAATLRPDLFSGGMEASGWLGEAHHHFAVTRPGVIRLRAKLPELANQAAPVIVLTRSMDDLARRIEQVTGFKVQSLAPDVPAKPKPAPSPVAGRDLAAERLDKLRKLAAQELPAHECAIRKEIIKARQELQRLGEAEGVGFVPV